MNYLTMLMLLAMRAEADKTDAMITHKAIRKEDIIWVGRIDEVYGDCMIAFGKSKKEVENLLFEEYKEIGRVYNKHYKTDIHGKRTKASFLEYHGAWIQPMAIGKAYSCDADESRNIKNILA